jgi:hypothetical protein
MIGRREFVTLLGPPLSLGLKDVHPSSLLRLRRSASSAAISSFQAAASRQQRPLRCIGVGVLRQWW